MTDIRADEEEDRLPWLEAVDDDDAQAQGPSTIKMIVAVLIALVGIGAIVGGIFWLSNRAQDGGGGEIIAAPEGDYKVPPDDPGGMTVEGEGGTAQAASAGADPKGAIDTNRMAEAPVDKAAPPAAQPQPRTTAETPAPTPAPAQPAAGGATIQLGAFSSQAGANAAWKALSGRFGYLAPLTHSVVPVTTGGKTLYRLRAGGPGAANICDRLKVAGESCVKL